MWAVYCLSICPTLNLRTYKRPFTLCIFAQVRLKERGVFVPKCTKMTTNGAAPAVAVKLNNSAVHQPAPLNHRILSTMDRRSVAAHPWHDLEIGVDLLVNRSISLFLYFYFYFFIFIFCDLCVHKKLGTYQIELSANSKRSPTKVQLIELLALCSIREFLLMNKLF